MAAVRVFALVMCNGVKLFTALRQYLETLFMIRVVDTRIGVAPSLCASIYFGYVMKRQK